MELPFFRTRFLLAVIATLCLFQYLQCAYGSEFVVGENGGWVVPPSNHTEIYNQWASSKRFKVNDTIRFKYKKDSVMEVTKLDYKECNSTQPSFFSNSDNTIFTLNRSGFFYFISGSAGHCDKGQRMIVWVVGQGASHGTSDASHDFLLSYGLLFIMFLCSFYY